MSSFESYDMESCKNHLRKMTTANCESIEELLSISTRCKWDVEQLEAITTKEIFKSLVSKRSHAFNLEAAQNLSNTTLKILNMDEASRWNSERVVLAHLANLTQNEVRKKS